MESPEQRAKRILRKDKFLAAYDHTHTALHFSSIALTNKASTPFLKQFIYAVEQQSRLLLQHNKPVENMQLRIRVIYKLENTLSHATFSSDYFIAIEKALLDAQKHATEACHTFGNITPFFKPINKINHQYNHHQANSH